MSLAELPATAPRLLTAEEFWALPEDGTSRELIRGELRERPMTVRNRLHSRVEANVAKLLGNWNDGAPGPRGEVVCGEAGFRLRRDPDTLVGIDVAYASSALLAATPAGSPYYEGAPVLAVEVLSPSDVHEALVEKVRLYLESGSVVWVIDPDFRLITVHRPGASAATVNAEGELDGGSYLPGFRVAASEVFA